MRNVTLAIEEEVLQKARVRAAKEGTTVNELIREHLAAYASQDERLQSAIRELLDLAAENRGSLKGWKFDREEIHRRGRSGGR